MRRESLGAWVATLVVAGALGCGSGGYGGSSGSPAPAPAQCTAANAEVVTGAIELVGMAFVPDCAKVALNTAVTFTNDDTVAHTVTTDAGQPETFDSGNLGQGAHFTHAFSTAGTVRIHCTIHPEMHLTVFVQ
jgi:plastocyanin